MYVMLKGIAVIAASAWLAACHPERKPEELWSGSWKLEKLTSGDSVTEENIRDLELVTAWYARGRLKYATFERQGEFYVFNRNIWQESSGDVHIFKYDPAQKIFTKAQTVRGRRLTSRIRFLSEDSFVLIKDNYDPQEDVDKEYFRRVANP